MARMYPSHLDPETKSAAERTLYHAFREQLDDSYLFFHQVDWLALDKQKRPRDGEADFVIVHPERGILVIEVKGVESAVTSGCVSGRQEEQQEKSTR